MLKVIDFTSTSENLLRNDRAMELKLKMLKQPLKLVKILVRTSEKTGKMLREKISDIMCKVNNIREIMQYGERQVATESWDQNIDQFGNG